MSRTLIPRGIRLSHNIKRISNVVDVAIFLIIKTVLAGQFMGMGKSKKMPHFMSDDVQVRKTVNPDHSFLNTSIILGS